MALDANKLAKSGKGFSKATYNTQPIGWTGKDNQNNSMDLRGAMKRRAEKHSKGEN